MEVYKIITDEEKLIEFINWLPDLQENEKYYLSLFARKKYCQELIKSNDKTQLKRFTANKENMLYKIKQLELPLGRWKLREMEAPQESLVLYIMPNPRCMKKATEMMGKKCWDLSRSNNFNLHQEAISCIQKSKSRSCFVDFDIDHKDWISIKKVKRILPPNTYSLIETKGGVHVLVDPKKCSDTIIKANKDSYHVTRHHLYNPNWHKDLTTNLKPDQSGDMMIPVVGCTQGNFTPKFIEI